MMRMCVRGGGGDEGEVCVLTCPQVSTCVSVHLHK